MNHPLVTGEWAFAGQTILHPIGLTLLIILGIAVQFVPRRYVIVPMFIMACFLSARQRITIVGADFTMLRMMVLFAWIRVMLKSEWRGVRFHAIDRSIILFAISGTVIYSIREGALGDLVYKLGTSFDALGMYFLFRCVIRSWNDLYVAIRSLTIISIPVSAAFIYEGMTQRNIFSVFGGIPEITAIREGRLRCQGAFSHPILAGCFWATMLPIMFSRWWARGKDRFFAILAFLTATTIIVMCASSTPVLGWAVCFVGAGAFLARYYMRWLRWGIVATLVLLHIVMNKPVWHLLGRINVVGGSTGYHRFQLVDGAVNYFHEWWLLGTKYTGHWGDHLFDVTNQFILEGVRGGLLTMILFILMIAFSFQRVGIAWRAVRHDPEKVALIWGLGVSLFSHCVIFVGVAYFGQIILAWYLTLGMIGSLPTVRSDAAGRAIAQPSKKRPAGPLTHHPPKAAQGASLAGGLMSHNANTRSNRTERGS